MAKMKHFPFGAFSWVDLTTTNDTAAIKFYSELLGWSDSGSANKDNGFYHSMKLGEGSIGGIFPLNEEMQKQGIPTFWNSYVQVKNADEIAERVSSNGGKVVRAPFDVFDDGRTGVFADPTGATFNIWEPKKHFGATPQDNKPGTFCWNELSTSDLEGAKSFYSSVFGWELSESAGPMGPYISIKNEGRANGGMMKKPPGQKGPDCWGVYFTVANCVESLSKVKSLGGNELMAPFDVPEVGKIAVVTDPQGAFFMIIELLRADET